MEVFEFINDQSLKLIIWEWWQVDVFVEEHFNLASRFQIFLFLLLLGNLEEFINFYLFVIKKIS